MNSFTFSLLQSLCSVGYLVSPYWSLHVHSACNNRPVGSLIYTKQRSPHNCHRANGCWKENKCSLNDVESIVLGRLPIKKISSASKTRSNYIILLKNSECRIDCQRTIISTMFRIFEWYDMWSWSPKLCTYLIWYVKSILEDSVINAWISSLYDLNLKFWESSKPQGRYLSRPHIKFGANLRGVLSWFLTFIHVLIH